MMKREATVARDTRHTRLMKLTLAALFVAVAYLCRFLIHFNVMFLTFDVKDAVVTVGALYLGPLWGIGMSLGVALIEFITISDTGLYGLMMNFLAAAAFSSVAALIYRLRRTMGGAILSLVLGACALVGIMLPANLLITPYYMGVELPQVVALIPTLLLPFNAVKGVINAGVVLLLYKPVTRALSRARAFRALTATRGATGDGEGKKTPEAAASSAPPRMLMAKIALLVIAAALLFFLLFLGGSFTFGK